MSVLESSNLRDLLRVRDHEDDGRDALAGLTLAAVLGCESNISNISNIRRPSRTLLDIIKDEQSGAAYRGLIPPSESEANKTSWKSFKSRLRLRRAGAAFSSSSSHPGNGYDDYAVEDCNIRISPPVLVELPRRLSRRNTSFNVISSPPIGAGATESTSNAVSTGVDTVAMEGGQRQAVIDTPIEQGSVTEVSSNMTGTTRDLGSFLFETPVAEMVLNSDENPIENNGDVMIGEVARAEEPVTTPRVSLMALLGETDWNAGYGGSVDMDSFDMGEELEEEHDDNLEEEAQTGIGEYVCCVCMVRHKGAAFIPCGHTFCRLCSRELWVNRGNCPLCNGYILEILDIF